ncbi:hypothetical protein TNCV_4440921 [Trichonephila clavipes]|nr:hypothetical protein TNCV_4440921 [Trichonephila clavipes]
MFAPEFDYSKFFIVDADKCVGRVRTQNKEEIVLDLVQKNPGTNNLMALHVKYDFWHMTAMAGPDVVQSRRPIFDDFFPTCVAVYRQ